MAENRHESQQVRAAKGPSTAQFGAHLRDLSAEEVLTELESAMDQMDDMSYDPDLMEAYLSSMEEKAPLEEQFDTQFSLARLKERLLI